jgi:Na+/H+ antiporter NhaC
MGEIEPSALSLAPALVTIVLAFATRQVLISLLAGVLTASVVLLVDGASLSEANPITAFFYPSIGSKDYAQILLIYMWCLGGLIGIWTRTGAAEHFARTVGSIVTTGPRSSLFFAWLMGCIFHQGGTVSTVLAGSTVKPVTDSHGVSHEELAYVVDSTASPVATIIPFNAWPAYVSSVVLGSTPFFLTKDAAFDFFISSMKFNFYAIFAVIGTLLFSLGWLPWLGRRMSAARERSRTGGGLDAPGATPLQPPETEETELPEGYTPHVADFLVPLSALLGLAILPNVFFDIRMTDEAFVLALVAGIAILAVRGMPFSEIQEGFLAGCRRVTIVSLVLGLAVTLGDASEKLGTAVWVVSTVGDLTPIALPALLTLLCMGIAFSTGTSWGTYAVVFPVAMPLAYALHPDPVYVQVCFGAVLGGSVYGDQCSPISDTTILSSMFTGCDLLDHVRTQMPLASAAAGIGIVLSTLIAWNVTTA